MLERISLDDGQVILNSERLSDSDVCDYLKSVGCESPESLYRLGDQIYLTDSAAWKDRYIPYFNDVGSLWHALRTKEEEPQHYFVIGVSQLEMVQFRLRLKLYFALRSMLKGLCHHEGEGSQPMKYVFFSSKESYLKKLEVPYAMSVQEFLLIESDDAAVDKAEILKSAVQHKEDVHYSERKHVMREALVEFFKDGGDQKFACLMTGVKKFYEAYTERYKVYVSKFSVNKILSEIESERVGFLCKIQDAIMSQQTKAFAIPGGLVAVGAILRFSNNFWDFCIIFIGLLLTTWMVTSLNGSAVKHIELLGDEFQKSVIKYDDVVVGVEEVKKEVERSREKLESCSKEAINKLSILTVIAWWVMVLVVVVLVGRSEIIDGSDLELFLSAFYEALRGLVIIYG